MVNAGIIRRSITWLKDVLGSPDINKRNMKNLSAGIERRINTLRNQRDKLDKQYKAILSSLGLEQILQEVRTSFLKFGGGSLNEILKIKGEDTSNSFKDFQTMTDPAFFLNNQGLTNRIGVLGKLFLQLQKGLKETKDSSIFQPRNHYEAILDRGIKAILKLQENELHLNQLDTVLKTLFQAAKILRDKLTDYSRLQRAISIEFWKAEGRKYMVFLCGSNREKKNVSAELEGLISDGKRLSHQLREEFPDQKSHDPLNLLENLKTQTEALEKAKFLSVSQQALGIVEGVNALDKGYSETQATLENLAGLRQNNMPDPTVLLQATFESFAEEEVRLAAQNRVLAGYLQLSGEETAAEAESNSPPPRSETGQKG